MFRDESDLLCWYHIDFNMDAKGVTPIPAPTKTHTEYFRKS
jgi:hypothetical protein